MTSHLYSRASGRPRRWAFVWVATMASLGAACQSKSPEPAAQAAEAVSVEGESSPAPGAEANGASNNGPSSYGEPLSRREAIDLGELVRAPAAHAGQTVLVEGLVRRACSAKGCWLEIATSAAPDAPGCRVTFKDYGFFVPTDSAGATARVQGTVEVTEVGKDHVEHLEGEGATFGSKKSDGTATELRLVATGVELRRG